MIRLGEPWLWATADGRMLTPDAMDSLIGFDRGLLVGRTASTVVLRDGTGELIFNRVREADYA